MQLPQKIPRGTGNTGANFGFKTSTIAFTKTAPVKMRIPTQRLLLSIRNNIEEINAPT